MEKILVTGSLAFDYIMNFDDRFKNHILPKKIHLLNVSFNVKRLKKQFGGTAGNIGYNLKLLGLNPIIVGTVGKDFQDYRKWLLKNKFDLSSIKKVRNDLTASAYIITDRDDNQITSFYAGAISQTRSSIKSIIRKKKPELGIISPTDPKVFLQYATDFSELKIPFIFDPGQIIPALSKETLEYCVKKAMMLIVNDYELSLIQNKTGLTLQDLKSQLQYLIITLGQKGSVIYHRGKKHQIPPAKPKNTSDPTGAGDAYRAGIIKGLIYGMDPGTMGKTASVAAIYTVEKYGTQTHRYSISEFRKRFKDNYGFEIEI